VSVREGGGDPRFDLRRHSPTGFEWGYGGSGPAQLALALAADLLGDDDRAQDVYQALKFQIIGRLTDDWVLPESTIRESIDRIERGQRKR
jgi:hypothetical protein